MLKHLLTGIVPLLMTMTLAGPAVSYDGQMADSYAKLFAPVKGEKAGKALHLMKAEDFIKAVKAGEPMVGLDVRTPAEASIFTVTLPGSLTIPIEKLLERENLDRIPTDKKVVVFCRSAHRALTAGTALRHVGFDNVYVLAGGFTALSAYLDQRTANMPLEPKHAAR